jgi:hypothetical protein
MPCYVPVVKMAFAMRCLAALAILSLILAPLARPAMVMPVQMQTGMAHHTMSVDGMADHATMAMPESMPCCPDEAPMSDCGKHCLMIMCAGTVVPMLPTKAGLPLLQSHSEKIGAMGAITLCGLSQRPPPKPPRA